MKIDEYFDGDVIDLGAAAIETRGIGSVGPEDVQTGQRYLFGGIQADD